MYRSKVVGTLELINAEGTRVCFERKLFNEAHQPPMQKAKDPACNMAHPYFLRSVDARSVETLCIDEYMWQGVGAEFLMAMLGIGDVRTLILSRGAVWSCLSALDEDPAASCHGQRFLQIHTLLIYAGRDQFDAYDCLSRPLLSIARKRKVAGYPFRFVSLFLSDAPKLEWDQVPEELWNYVERLEVVTGDDALDWDVDKYFLDGLE